MKRQVGIYVCASLALSVLGSSCLVTPYGDYRAGFYVEAPQTEFGYEPVLYDGYVVYYTQDSVPFYWVNNVQVSVPTAHRGVYVQHYRQHQTAYQQWHAQRGNRYRGHRYQLKERRRPQAREVRANEKSPHPRETRRHD